MKIMGKVNQFKELLLVIFISLVAVTLGIFIYRESFFLTREASEYKYYYDISQYVLGTENKNVMGDADLYVFSGISYLTGVEPTKINFEHPPLVKYLFGLSYMIFEAPNWINLLFTMIAIGSFYYLCRLIIERLWVRLLALGIFLVNPLTLSLMTQSMLDFAMMSLVLALVAFYAHYLSKPSLLKAIVLGIVGGLLIASKYPFPILLLLVGLILLHGWYVNRKISHLIISAIVVMSVYLIMYLPYFLAGNNLLDFIKFEWWRLSWYMGKKDNPKGLLLLTIFFGKHNEWWSDAGGMVSYKEWNPIWPITFILYLLSLFTKRVDFKSPLFPYMVWLLATFLFYLIGVSAARFILALWPGWVLFSFYWIDSWLLVRLNKSSK